MAHPVGQGTRREDAAAPGQGRLLGHRDQAVPGPGPGRLPGVHPQGRHRYLLPGLRALPAVGVHPWGDLPAVRQPQRPHRQLHPVDGRRAQAAARVRVPAPARHGRRTVRHCAGKAWQDRAHLCPGRRAQGSAALPGAAPAGKRRELLVRPPVGRPEHADRVPSRSPGDATAQVQNPRQ
ncbi:hypothetical protein D3C80_1530140 [compost metagenome]